MAENTNIEDLRAPLLAALGAADLALATVNDLITTLRERAEETRTDTRSRVEDRRTRLSSRVEESRSRLTNLREDLPEQLNEQIAELRERFTPRSCARPPRVTWRLPPAGTTNSSSVARPRWSGCAASRRSRTRRLGPRVTSIRLSS